jgi:hypothetical protein
MNAARREVLATAGRALLWLPLCLAAWYVAAGVIGWLPSHLATPAIASAAGRVTQVATAARTASYTVRVEGPYMPGVSSQAEARVDVPSATYTFGMAVFAALALAVKGWRHPGRLALGIAILLPLPAFGIAFDALRQLGAAPQLAPLLGWKGGTREAITLGYQVGSLLLPTLGPIIAWLALFPNAWKTGARPGPGPGLSPIS